jgi:hypothetical protein
MPGLVMDMIATLLPVLVPAALVEPAAMRENRPREKHHQNENQELYFHFYLSVISYPPFL